VGPFLTKELLIFWRNRMEVLMSLIMPIIIILVLSSTTSTWVEKKNDSLQMTVAIVNEDQQLADDNQSNQMQPVQMLMKFLSSEQMTNLVSTVNMNRLTANQRLHNEDVDAIITIPSGFTQATLNKMLLNEGSGASLTLTAGNRASLKVDILQDMLDGFIQSMNLHTAIAHATDAKLTSLGAAEEVSAVGGYETIASVQMLTSFQYYAIAISLIFVMFLASSTALRAITEKREHVFQRILLSGSHPLRYLAGKAGATFILSVLQLSVVIVVCHLIFHLFPGRSVQFWSGAALIIVMYSLSVAALSTLFTSLTFRLKDSAVSGLFTFVIMVIGTIGGSFVPKYILPDWLKQVGEWTPNGLSLSVFIQWLQQDSLSNLIEPILKLIIFSVGMILIGTWIFPRRGRI
jgi:ABC-2 type transport system permease protein